MSSQAVGFLKAGLMLHPFLYWQHAITVPNTVYAQEPFEESNSLTFKYAFYEWCYCCIEYFLLFSRGVKHKIVGKGFVSTNHHLEKARDKE